MNPYTETERETERDRDRERDRQRQAEREGERHREIHTETQRHREAENKDKLDRYHQRNFENSKLMRQILVEYFWKNIFIYASDF